MKISFNWLQEYLPIDLPIEQVCELLTDIGLEVEGVEQVESIKGGLQDLVIGEVITCKKHENADRLQVCEVTIGQENNLQIVCGAPNVAAGQKVIVAPVGTTIFPVEHDSFTIREAKIRGVKSFGMICAEDEIGLGKSHDGILVLESNAKVGTLAKDFFDVESDTVIEIGLTPNRSDANSHLGVARDIAAALAIQHQQNSVVNWPDVSTFSVEEQSTPIQVEVKAKEACPRYAGVVISNVNIKPSPNWLQIKLKAIGVKPINTIVDITNFINHEYGQPLHAFDYDKIAGQSIVVQHLPEGTSFISLDGVERTLSNEDLMICDQNGGMCIAGVYGGLHSGVTDETKSIFLESAYFDPSTIRRTELRHNLRTDAAAKFEKGVDPTKQVEVLQRAALLIKELAGGTISSKLIDVYPTPIEPASIQLSYERLNQLTGVQFNVETVKQILALLDFKIVEETDQELSLQAPLYRADVIREADVIEEVLRIYGFNHVPLSGSTSFSLNYTTNHEEEVRNQLANHLVGKGLQEIITNSISRSSYYNNFPENNEKEFVKPINSLNSQLNVMRPDMLMTGLEAIAYNLNRNMNNCQFFDFGKTYAKDKEQFSEQNQLAIYLTGKREEASWLQQSKNFDFYHCKQLVQEVLNSASITEWKEQELRHVFWQEGLIYLVNEREIAKFGSVHPKLLQQFDIDQSVEFATIHFDYLLELSTQKTKQFQPISKFPVIERDLALVIDSSVNYQQIKEIAHKKGGEFLQSMNLFDVFTSEEKLGKNKKSYAVSFTFENKEKTLTNEQIDQQMNQLMKAFTSELNAEIRS